MTCEHEDCRASLGRDPGYVYRVAGKKPVRCCSECWAQMSRRDNRESSDKKHVRKAERK